MMITIVDIVHDTILDVMKENSKRVREEESKNYNIDNFPHSVYLGSVHFFFLLSFFKLRQMSFTNFYFVLEVN